MFFLSRLSLCGPVMNWHPATCPNDSWDISNCLEYIQRPNLLSSVSNGNPLKELPIWKFTNGISSKLKVKKIKNNSSLSE